MRKSLSGTIYSAIILLTIIFAGSGCTKTPKSTAFTVPSVVTFNVVSSLTQTTVQSGGITTNAEGDDISANGVCWSATNTYPTIADSHTADTVNANGFISRVTGLTANTTYYLRAYSTNTGGAGYGAVVKFTTSASTTSVTTAVTTFAGASTYGYQDGLGTAALFNGPMGLSYNSVNGKIYVMDALNNLIRTITAAGQVTTFTNPTLGYADGALSAALFYGPHDIAFDTQGNGYVSDVGNNRIRKITAAGVVSTFAGIGTQGYVDGAATVAEFRNPQGLAVDASGNVYVADQGNNLIRKITSAGVVSTLAGYPPQVGGNPIKGYVDTATSSLALFNAPCGVALDPAGNVYVADFGNHAIRKISTAGAVTTFAGTPVQKSLIGSPVAIKSDATGNLFIVDETGRILEITTAKVLYVLAGTSNLTGFVNGAGTAALFNSPQGVATDGQGNVYVGDFNNNSIRKITVKFN